MIGCMHFHPRVYTPKRWVYTLLPVNVIPSPTLPNTRGRGLHVRWVDVLSAA
jgi:hypothetical protein